jgi:hypothetical protein
MNKKSRKTLSKEEEEELERLRKRWTISEIPEDEAYRQE